MPEKDTPIRLSPTTGLNLYEECLRCFWQHFNEGIHRYGDTYIPLDFKTRRGAPKDSFARGKELEEHILKNLQKFGV